MSVHQLVDFDDGHKPGKTSDSTKIAVHKDKNQSNFVCVFDDLMEEKWCDRIYEYSATFNESKPWGVYILTSDVVNSSDIACEDLWCEAEKAMKDENGIMRKDDHINDLFQRAIGLYTSRQLLLRHGKNLLGRDMNDASNTTSTPPRVHGTVVWCLCSTERSSVEYHIDYAELYRYETNVIYPPLYAGTAHVSPLNHPDKVNQIGDDAIMTGGSFCVNTGGLRHYQKFGYKGKLAQYTTTCNTQHAVDSNNDSGESGTKAVERATTSPVLEDLLSSSDWQEIRYRYNRGILHDGDFPHLSTPVTHLPTGIKRCILGFNCFSAEVGECCMRAPEHSKAFNRTIRLYQTLGALTAKSSEDEVDNRDPTRRDESLQSEGKLSDTSKTGLSAKDILKNAALARLLVKAAKLKKAHDEQQTKDKGQLFDTK